MHLVVNGDPSHSLPNLEEVAADLRHLEQVQRRDGGVIAYFLVGAIAGLAIGIIIAYASFHFHPKPDQKFYAAVAGFAGAVVGARFGYFLYTHTIEKPRRAQILAYRVVLQGS